MKLLYFHQYFVTDRQNGGTRSFEFARRLVKLGHEVSLISARNDKSTYLLQAKKIQVQGIDVYYVNIRSDRFDSKTVRVFAHLIYLLGSFIIAFRIKPTIIFATSTPITIAIPAIFHAKIKGKPMVFEVRDLWPDIPIRALGIKSHFIISAASAFEKWVYRQSRAVIALSPTVAQIIEDRCDPTTLITTIPNGCDLPIASLEEQPINLKERFGFESGSLIGIYTGSIGFINGLDYLVAISTKLQDINRRIKFVIVGEGPEKKRFQALVESNNLNRQIVIVDAVPKSEIQKWIKEADFAMSIFKPDTMMEHNSANKFFDGLSVGKPIIINYGGWQSLLLKKYKCGLSLEGASPIEAAETISKHVNNQTWMSQASLNARILAEEKFSRDKQFLEFEKTLSKISS